MLTLDALLTDDDRSTVEAALAFIDAHFGGSTPTSNDNSAKRARNRAAAARTHSRRRAELLRLREESEALQTTLNTLSARVGAKRLHVATEICSLEHVDDQSARLKRRPLSGGDAMVVEMEKLASAKKLNRRLREAWDHQREVGKQLAQLIQRRLSAKCVQDLLRDAAIGSTAISTGPSFARDRRSILDDLSAQLRKFKREANAMVDDARHAVVLDESRTRVVSNATYGPVIEMTWSKQLPCGLEDGWAYLMSVYCDLFRTVNCHEYEYTAQVRSTEGCSASEKDYTLAFRDAERPEPVRVEGLALFEMFDLPECKLFLFVSVVSVRGTGVHVRERGWTVMTCSTTDPENAIVMHQRHELHCASADPSAKITGPQTKYLAESLLQKARRDCQRAEDTMAQRFGADASCIDSLFK